MSRFIVFRKLTGTEAEECIAGLEKWFANNPRRQVCNTDLFKVYRGKVRETVMAVNIEISTPSRV